MQQYKKSGDYVLRIEHFPSPYCIVRHTQNLPVPVEELRIIGSILASYSNKAYAFFAEKKERISIKIEHEKAIERILVEPMRSEHYKELHFDEIKEELQKRKKNMAE